MDHNNRYNEVNRLSDYLPSNNGQVAILVIDCTVDYIVPRNRMLHCLDTNFAYLHREKRRKRKYDSNLLSD